MHRRSLGLALFTSFCAACGTPSSGSDAGPRDDSGPIVQGLVSSASGPVDLSCVGHVTLPAATETVSGTLHFYEYLSMSPITSNAVDIFDANAITDTCAEPDCTTYTTDAQGNLALTLPAGAWFAFRLHVSGQTTNVLAFDQPWLTAPGAISVPGFAPGTITIVGMLLNRTFQADRLGSMSGRAVDCLGQPLANVRPRVFVADTEVITGPIGDTGSPRISGLEASMPTRTGLTGASGNFVGANVPPGDDVHVEMWATLVEGGDPQLIGCTEARVVAGGITLAIIGGLRSDYAPSSRCALAAQAQQ